VGGSDVDLTPKPDDEFMKDLPVENWIPPPSTTSFELPPPLDMQGVKDRIEELHDSLQGIEADLKKGRSVLKTASSVGMG